MSEVVGKVVGKLDRNVIAKRLDRIEGHLFGGALPKLHEAVAETEALPAVVMLDERNASLVWTTARKNLRAVIGAVVELTNKKGLTDEEVIESGDILGTYLSCAIRDCRETLEDPIGCSLAVQMVTFEPMIGVEPTESTAAA